MSETVQTTEHARGENSMPSDYEVRTYAGVLGKVIGVYLGRPFEGWTNELIEKRLGEIDYYVHEKVGVRLIVTDDDISGTFTFIRALEDYGFDASLTPKQIGQTWLNYLINGRSVLWWGGLGNSTEHTAYLRLTSGIDAPLSGSIATNGKVVAEQIGAQIFIDGWAMVNPGDPERAADFARRAASVSHDGEAIIGAQILAAMEAQAYVEQDLNELIDTGLSVVPEESTLVQMIQDIREWHAEFSDDWRKTFARLKARYGYDKYGGNCHIVPNHGLIILALLHGDGSFHKSLNIVNTAGWDTDCNSGNLGCLMGIRNGLEGIDSGPDWRGPVADICYVPTADSGGGITDVATIARNLVRTTNLMHGCTDIPPKDGARFHFSYPGSVQGFTGVNCKVHQSDSPVSQSPALQVDFESVGDESIRATTCTFIDSLETAQYFGGRGYGLMASPTLNSGQLVSSEVANDPNSCEPATVTLCIGVFNDKDEVVYQRGAPIELMPSESQTLEWRVPDVGGFPISCVGLEVLNPKSKGCIYLDRLHWTGAPVATLSQRLGQMWRRAWVNGVDACHHWGESFRLIQNKGTGLMLYGNRDWRDYRLSADVTPHLVRRAGIACRVQGMRRYYALVLTVENQLMLVRELEGSTILDQVPCTLDLGRTYDFAMEVKGTTLIGYLDNQKMLEANDSSLTSGGIALLIDEGRSATQQVSLTNITG